MLNLQRPCHVMLMICRVKTMQLFGMVIMMYQGLMYVVVDHDVWMQGKAYIGIVAASHGKVAAGPWLCINAGKS